MELKEIANGIVHDLTRPGRGWSFPGRCRGGVTCRWGEDPPNSLSEGSNSGSHPIAAPLPKFVSIGIGGCQIFFERCKRRTAVREEIKRFRNGFVVGHAKFCRYQAADKLP